MVKDKINKQKIKRNGGAHVNIAKTNVMAPTGGRSKRMFNCVESPEKPNRKRKKENNVPKAKRQKGPQKERKPQR